MKKVDYLIIGSGIAGLSLALKLAEHFPNKSILIVTKSNKEESNTKYAQGGIAVVSDFFKDSYEQHIKDTLICGDGLCNEQVVDLVVREGRNQLKSLIDWGVNFDQENGNLLLGKEGGHTTNRIVHSKDETGYEIEKALLKHSESFKNIEIIENNFVLDLIVQDNICFGVYVLNKENEKRLIFSKFTILASGGIGQVYGHTTNPKIATGDGIAMASRAKAKIVDMEFIQFHPTALFSKNLDTTFLISEAVRGDGAFLRNINGERFMAKYDKRAELASRDIISKSIVEELQNTKSDCVYLDCSHMEKKAFQNHFPNILEKTEQLGLDISKDFIPVAPAQHYVCGGIAIDVNGKTSIENLFACGECSRTGLHGANRLASNSLLEALVYSNQIFNYLRNDQSIKEVFTAQIFLSNQTNLIEPDNEFLSEKKAFLQRTMIQNAGIVRNNRDLKLTLKALLNLKQEVLETEKTHQVNVDFYELKNMIQVGILIVQQSIKRNENRGSFYKMKL